jgi:hypothetical protein
VIEPDAIDGAYTPRQAADVAGVELDGEAVLYHERLGIVCVLNPTATLVWGCLDGSSDLDALAGELAEAFAADAGTIREEVLAAVRGFGRLGLLADVTPDPDQVATQALPGLDLEQEPPDG